MKNPLVTFMAHDAFTLPPEELGHFDWVFSDVICYPERLLGWVQKWIDSRLCDNMICTIKMQGEIRWDLIAEFASIPGSRVVHLNYNKHELSFLWKGER
jgi:23S rRNA (cytidine2498-2'-O)-methyltransferase